MSDKSKTHPVGAVGGSTSGATGDSGDIGAPSGGASTSASRARDGPDLDISLVKALIAEAVSERLGAVGSTGPPEKTHGGAIAGRWLVVVLLVIIEWLLWLS